MVNDFIETYFINPILYGSGYNIYNTLVYAIILILSVYVVYKLLIRLNIKIDNKFLIGVFPFVALGGILRAFQDASTIVNPLLVTPLIYFLIFFIAFTTLLASKGIEKLLKKEYYKTWALIGFVSCLLVLSQMTFVNIIALFLVIKIFSIWCAALFMIKRFNKNKKISKFLTNQNIFLILVHMFDATTTFVALQFFSYWEQHVVPSFVINVLGPVSMFLLKLPIVVLVLYLLDKEMQKDLQKRDMIKLAILVLGLGPGLRNLLRLVMGV